jgi:hypothetical protein
LDSSMNKVHHGFWHFGIDQGKENVNILTVFVLNILFCFSNCTGFLKIKAPLPY